MNIKIEIGGTMFTELCNYTVAKARVDKKSAETAHNAIGASSPTSNQS